VKDIVSHCFELLPLDLYWHGIIVILSNHPMVEMKTVLYFTTPNPYPPSAIKFLLFGHSGNALKVQSWGVMSVNSAEFVRLS